MDDDELEDHDDFQDLMTQHEQAYLEGIAENLHYPLDYYI